MSLSCSCGDSDDYDWMYWIPSDFSKMPIGRRKRCCSCKKMIGILDTVVRFNRSRKPCSEIEERICGDEIDIAPLYMCESCGEIFLNLESAGFCINIEESMHELLEEYHGLTGWKGGAE